MYQQSFDIFK